MTGNVDMERFRRVYGTKIRRARKKLRISQRDLAELIGISNTLLCRIERGHHFPSFETIMKLEDALGFKQWRSLPARPRIGDPAP